MQRVPERIQWVEARGRAFSFTLHAGLPLLEAARRGFAEAGFAGGVLNMRGGALGPFAYVMPALSKTGDHAAFYSDTFRPAGVTRLKIGAMTLGERDGAPFFHCHALWTESGWPIVNGGHILPEETIVAEPFEVDAFGIDGAMFRGRAGSRDQFQTVRTGGPRGHGRETPAAPLRCGCGRTRISPARWKVFAASTAFRGRASAAASAAPSARALRMAAAWCRSPPNLRSGRV